MKPKVSVVIPCYNQAEFLVEAVESVISQTYKNWECIIVNDGSLDETDEIAKKLESKDLRIRYLKKENGGLSDARNAGIALAIGDYILPLDADDKIGSEYLEEAVHVLETNNNVKIVYCYAEFFGEKSGTWNLPEFSIEKMLLYNLIFCTALFRKEDYERTSGYDIGMKYGWEDWDFWLSILENGGEVYKLNDTYFFYRVKESSMILSMTPEESIYLKKRVYSNHSEMYGQLFSDPISLYEENLRLIVRSKRLQESKYYKLGYFLLSPFKIIHNFFKRV